MQARTSTTLLPAPLPRSRRHRAPRDHTEPNGKLGYQGHFRPPCCRRSRRPRVLSDRTQTHRQKRNSSPVADSALPAGPVPRRHGPSNNPVNLGPWLPFSAPRKDRLALCAHAENRSSVHRNRRKHSLAAFVSSVSATGWGAVWRHRHQPTRAKLLVPGTLVTSQ